MILWYIFNLNQDFIAMDKWPASSWSLLIGVELDRKKETIKEAISWHQSLPWVPFFYHILCMENIMLFDTDRLILNTKDFYKISKLFWHKFFNYNNDTWINICIYEYFTYLWSTWEMVNKIYTAYVFFNVIQTFFLSYNRTILPLWCAILIKSETY